MAADQCFVSWSLGERLTGDGDDDWRTGKNDKTKCRIIMKDMEMMTDEQVRITKQNVE